ncbi:MAG: SDR family NAD(P)-dependent oxidoreductase [Lewinellaceae bacterium]|nr:SDR family NAD(P)-dependent oxidoreductase [Lewinellaceae bacterium]
MRLSDNTILITGGTSGIGLALGKALLEMNNQVILLGRNKEKLAELEKAGFETISCDLNKLSDIEEASVLIQNKYPQLNMLFNSIMPGYSIITILQRV